MTFRAVLDDGKEHRPVLLMLKGEMSPRQIDKEYCGCIGKCPDCDRFFSQTDLSMGGTLAVPMLVIAPAASQLTHQLQRATTEPDCAGV